MRASGKVAQGARRHPAPDPAAAVHDANGDARIRQAAGAGDAAHAGAHDDDAHAVTAVSSSVIASTSGRGTSIACSSARRSAALRSAPMVRQIAAFAS